jgi:hypothetical protein
MTTLKITFDGEKPVLMSLSGLLVSRTWSANERRKIELVETGLVRRMSTDLDGRPCDVELAR